MAKKTDIEKLIDNNLADKSNIKPNRHREVHKAVLDYANDETILLREENVRLKDELTTKINTMAVGIQGEAFPNSIGPKNNGMYTVQEPGIYLHFLDEKGEPISVTQEDYDTGLVYLVYNGKSCFKSVTPITNNGEVREGDKRGVNGDEVYIQKTNTYDEIVQTYADINTLRNIEIEKNYGKFIHQNGRLYNTTKEGWFISQKIKVDEDNVLVVEYEKEQQEELNYMGVWGYPNLDNEDSAINLTPKLTKGVQSVILSKFTKPMYVMFSTMNNVGNIRLYKKNDELLSTLNSKVNSKIEDIRLSFKLSKNFVKKEIIKEKEGYYHVYGEYRKDYKKSFVSQGIKVSPGQLLFLRNRSEALYANVVLFNEKNSLKKIVKSNLTLEEEGNYDYSYYYNDTNDILTAYISSFCNTDDFRGNIFYCIENVNEESKVAWKRDSNIVNSNIRYPQLSQGGVISFIDDDGNEEAYNYLYPYMRSKGLAIGFALVQRWTQEEKQSYEYGKSMTISNALEISKDYVYAEVLNHTFSHKDLAVMTEEELHKEFDLSQGYFSQILGGYTPKSVVYPFGNNNDLVKRVASNYFICGYDFNGWGENTINSINNFNIARINFGKHTTVQGVKDRIDKVIEKNQWLVITTHIGGFDDYPNWKIDFEEVIQYILDKKVKVMKPSDAFMVFGNILEAGTKRVNANGQLL